MQARWMFVSCVLPMAGRRLAAPAMCSEGTLAYFFSTEALRAAATAVGFQEVECEYARVEVRGARPVLP